jgi:DNA gyrase subunit B
MAGKKVKSEVEGIRNELQNLSEAVWALRERVTVQGVVAAASIPNPLAHSTPTIEIARDLEHMDGRGMVVSRGVVRDASGSREYRWDQQGSVETLLSQDDDMASRLLAAIGHRQRLAILKAILNRPTTAAELVGALDLGTTGAAYHHLNVLQSADLITQENRGVFVVQPHRVSAIYAILAGIESASSTIEVEPSAEPDISADGEVSGKRKKVKAA